MTPSPRGITRQKDIFKLTSKDVPTRNLKTLFHLRHNLSAPVSFNSLLLLTRKCIFLIKVYIPKYLYLRSVPYPVQSEFERVIHHALSTRRIVVSTESLLVALSVDI